MRFDGWNRAQPVSGSRYLGAHLDEAQDSPSSFRSLGSQMTRHATNLVICRLWPRAISATHVFGTKRHLCLGPLSVGSIPPARAPEEHIDSDEIPFSEDPPIAW